MTRPVSTPGPALRAGALITAFALYGLLSGCAGEQACDALGTLQAEREQRRADQQQLIEDRTAGDDQIGAADDRLHAFERRVFELEQRCGSS